MPAQRKDRAISLRNRSAGAVRGVSAREVPAPPSARDTVGRLSARDVRTREGRNLLRPNHPRKTATAPAHTRLQRTRNHLPTGQPRRFGGVLGQHAPRLPSSKPRLQSPAEGSPLSQSCVSSENDPYRRSVSQPSQPRHTRRNRHGSKPAQRIPHAMPLRRPPIPMRPSP